MKDELNDIEYDILNALYFVEPFEHILAECNAKPSVVADVLKQLIHRKFVVAMQWDDEKKEFIRSFMYDSDDMNRYHYLATKNGLLAHNGRL